MGLGAVSAPLHGVLSFQLASADPPVRITCPGAQLQILIPPVTSCDLNLCSSFLDCQRQECEGEGRESWWGAQNGVWHTRMHALCILASGGHVGIVGVVFWQFNCETHTQACTYLLKAET